MINKQYTSGCCTSKRPEAFITINKNRIKTYNNGYSLFLENGQKFEIELFNPLGKKVLAKIAMNEKLISNSGIILRPGERIYLERYIDNNNSFIFETYQVEDNSDVIKAIKNNGNIKVYFYEESDFKNPYIPYINPQIIWTQIPAPAWITTAASPHIYYSGTSNKSLGCVGYSGPMGCPGTLGPSSSFGMAGTVETGRIEMGDATQQKLVESYDEFKSFYFHTVEYKIEPKSAKHIESCELRQYCTECGSKIKKHWKHCPNCGNKI